MNLGFYISGVAGQMAQNKLDGIANNLANVNTVGYMQDRTAFSSMFSNQMGRTGAPDSTSAAYLSTNTQYISTESGNIRQTGGDLDFAINGKGYFRVQMQDGSEALTRAGNFKTDGEGTLMTQSGLKILDKNGAPVQLPIGKVSTTENGSIYVNGQPVADLGISMITDPKQMEKIGGVLIKTPQANTTPADNTISVHQGSLEDANVNSVLAMTQIVDTMRSYQSMMKVVEQYNQIASQLSDRVGMVQG
ncbi:flagellar hook-basal body protein [Mariprofundus erugo]|uniref:Flagellar hook-basal body protein n=1 Tax=Mariprofundus erugo TaxID=2528639 RepID=A0A5R9GTV1_9PROT|nr:flagellar hook-basal body protein [Mariprofundus erugo]TLS66674.1 flagellar hook-basal body protein [Mariprofundus erugo]TLS74543.1 flagellar hook-basal body protein [Mariprofundus erugo]